MLIIIYFMLFNGWTFHVALSQIYLIHILFVVMAASLPRCASLPSPLHLPCAPDQPHLRRISDDLRPLSACNQCSYLSSRL